ncbi:hypothetical protein MTR_4g107120 [Medicago truncatula]|uniref:Uncharacterized protein n=1 Tax=Medicago truncatula TaxID=3880 RepID=A0A072UQD8_MEDTR|nr:hypothetical protein MTR_4g107120 [Medicago truncatula]
MGYLRPVPNISNYRLNTRFNGAINSIKVKGSLKEGRNLSRICNFDQKFDQSTFVWSRDLKT